MKIHECQQGSPEWFAVRLGKVTASCFGDAVAGGQGKVRKTYMIKLIAERMTGESENGYTNATIQRGSEVELLAREYYELLNDCPVRQVGFIERDEYIGASPDGLVGDDGMLEIKCPFSSTHIRYIIEERLPTAYKKQVQGQLWVAEREWVDFISYDPRVHQKPYFCERVYRDEEYIKELQIKIYMFVSDMQKLMERLTTCPF